MAEKRSISKPALNETLAYAVLWAILYASPIVSLWVTASTKTDVVFSWTEVFHVWEMLTAFFVAFLIHNYLIAPLLVKRHKKLQYFAALTLLGVVFGLYQCSHEPGDMPRPPREGVEQPIGTPPPPPPKPPVDMHDVAAMVIFVTMAGMNLGMKLFFSSKAEREKLQALEKKSLEQQLEYLKYQINPHFFMNTLNNIHALVDIEPEQAKSSILELSKMMRYMLYETNKSLVPLQREIDLLNNYIALMRLRYTSRVDINFTTPSTVPQVMVPPLLFIAFVENAFKHGVSYTKPSFIDVDIAAADGRVAFTCRNSNVGDNDHGDGGVGLQNVRQRLDLMFADRYTLDIDEGDDTYNVRLTFPVLTEE